jgi:hypothetical protein
MDAFRIVGIVLTIVGALGLAFGSFSYTKETREAELGQTELNVQEQADG